MTLQPPNPTIEPRFAEEISNSRLHQIFRQIQQNFDNLHQQFPVQPADLAGSRVLDELPAEAFVGSTVIFEAAPGIFWQLLYTGEATYPWAKIGGPALRAVDATEPGRSTKATTFQSTGAPSITAPLAMEFEAAFGTRYTNCEENGVNQAEVGLHVNGFAVYAIAWVTTVAFSMTPMAGRWRHTVAKGQAIQPRYATTAGTTSIRFNGLYIEVDPVRVG